MPTIATQTRAVKTNNLETELMDIDTGVLKDIPAKSSLTINGNAMNGSQIDTQIKAYLKTINAADTAKQRYQTALVARRNMQLEARDFYLQLKKAIIAYFGARNATLGDFGLTPAKPKAVKTSAELALSRAKAEITRAARGTKSKKAAGKINPTVGTPAVVIGPDGKLLAVAPTVIDGAVPVVDAVAPSGSNSASSTPPQGSAGSGNGGQASPAAPAAGSPAGKA